MLIDTKNVLIQVDSDNISSIKQDTNETNIELMLLYVIGNFNLFKYNAFYYMEYPWNQGLRLELCAKDRVGLLSEVTRILRENGLSVSRAGVSTVGEQAVNVFFVRDPSGNPVDMKTIEGLRKEIGHTMMLNVKKVPTSNTKAPEASGWAKTSFFVGNLLEKFLAWTNVHMNVKHIMQLYRIITLCPVSYLDRVCLIGYSCQLNRYACNM